MDGNSVFYIEEGNTKYSLHRMSTGLIKVRSQGRVSPDDEKAMTNVQFYTLYNDLGARELARKMGFGDDDKRLQDAVVGDLTESFERIKYCGIFESVW